MSSEIMLDPDTMTGDARAYAGGDELARLRAASPLFADLSGLPPTLVQIGDLDILAADGQRFAHGAAAAGNPIELELYPQMWHVWHSAAPLLPEANAAIASCGCWLRSAASGDARA